MKPPSSTIAWLFQPGDKEGIAGLAISTERLQLFTAYRKRENDTI